MLDELKESLRDYEANSLYDFNDEENETNFYREKEGLTRDIVEKISREKEDPDWMREFRLKCLDIYNEMDGY